MDMDELRSVRRTEREKDSLQHLRDSFYEDVAAYLSDLAARRDRAAADADDPFAAPEVRQLTDEIETAEEVVEAIYERRVGKIVKQASFAAADMSADRNGLTAEEAELFDDLVARIKQNKATVLETLAGESDAGEPDPGSVDTPERSVDAPDQTVGDTTAQPTSGSARPTSGSAQSTSDNASTVDAVDANPQPPEEPASVLAEAMGSEAGDGPEAASRQPSAESRSENDEDVDSRASIDTESPSATDGGTTLSRRTTVRITRDVGEILGVDERAYDLEREDVVTLPATNAEPLIERDAAEPLE